MAAKKPEDQVKELARLKENKGCFNCKSGGLQNNVCLTFGTFICTKCAGIHRQYSHVCKTINMSNFSKPEVDALKAGGNQKAASTWLATPPDFVADPNSDESLKSFIEQCFVQKKWFGEAAAILLKESKKEKKSKKSKKKDDGEEEKEPKRKSKEKEEKSPPKEEIEEATSSGSDDGVTKKKVSKKSKKTSTKINPDSPLKKVTRESKKKNSQSEENRFWSREHGIRGI